MEDEYWFCCSNEDEILEKPELWHCYLATKAKGWFGRNHSKPENAKRLLDGVKEILKESEGITDIQWTKAP